MPRPAPENSCSTCRKRKMKCDGALPVCQNCQKSRRPCARSREARPKYIIHAADPDLQRSIFEAQEQPNPNGKHNEKAQLPKAPSSASSSPSAALEDPLIASIFRHYIDVLAPWYDLNDAQNMFGTIVPLRALSNTILFKALVAFSACHLNRTRKISHEMGTLYHGSCVEELLDVLNDTSLALQEDYLAATCLLRSYEILNGDMRRHQNHLLGAYSFATNSPINLTVRGLAQAGTWNYLREEITVALESRRPVRLSAGFHFVPEEIMADDKWANYITIILAKTINFCFSDATNEDEQERTNHWRKIVEEVSSWRQNLPVAFHPFSTALKPGNVFPSIWLLRPWHVAAEQYCSVTEILLELSRLSSFTAPPTPSETDSINDTILCHAVKICALAYTNDDVSARVNAFGPLAFCGRFLIEDAHRDALILMLREFSKPTGWPVAPIVQDLQRHWEEDDKLPAIVTSETTGLNRGVSV